MGLFRSFGSPPPAFPLPEERGNRRPSWRRTISISLRKPAAATDTLWMHRVSPAIQRAGNGSRCDKEINVAVFVWIAPSVGAKKINLLRLKLGFQPLNGTFQKARRDCLHGRKLALRRRLWKPEFEVIERGFGGWFMNGSWY